MQREKMFKELDEYFEEFKVFENEKSHFYRSKWTDSANRYARDYGFDNLFCFIAVMKENEEDRSYVLIREQEVVYDTKQYEALCSHIDIMAIAEDKELNKSDMEREIDELDTNGS
jgi:hypothetical protein